MKYNNKLVTKVLTYLKAIAYSKNTTLPTKGILAGGSVANCLYGFTHNIKPIINDLDVFSIGFPNQYNLSSSTNYYSALSNFMITSVSRKNLLNSIGVSPIVEEEEVSKLRTRETQVYSLLNSFDLNCCQAAIDLKTKKLYTTPDFDQFLETKLIQLTHVRNVATTCFRILKKRDELKCSVDIQRLILLSSQPFNIVNKKTPLLDTNLLDNKDLHSVIRTLFKTFGASQNKKSVTKKDLIRATQPFGCSYVMPYSVHRKLTKYDQESSKYFHIIKDKSRGTFLIPKNRFILPIFKDVKSASEFFELLPLETHKHLKIETIVTF